MLPLIVLPLKTSAIAGVTLDVEVREHLNDVVPLQVFRRCHLILCHGGDGCNDGCGVVGLTSSDVADVRCCLCVIDMIYWQSWKVGRAKCSMYSR